MTLLNYDGYYRDIHGLSTIIVGVIKRMDILSVYKRDAVLINLDIFRVI